MSQMYYYTTRSEGYDHLLLWQEGPSTHLALHLASVQYLMTQEDVTLDDLIGQHEVKDPADWEKIRDRFGRFWPARRLQLDRDIEVMATKRANGAKGGRPPKEEALTAPAQAIPMEEAQEILGDAFSVYEALTQYWDHKKVTEEDCHTIRKLIHEGKVTADKLSAAIIKLAHKTPQDKRQYMKSVKDWLAQGNWAAKQNITNQPQRLQSVEQVAADEYLDKRGM